MRNQHSDQSFLDKKRVKLTLLLIVVITFIVLLVRPYYLFATDVLHISPLKTLFTRGNIEVIDNGVNILLLGIAGGAHDGPNLSDSITVMHIDLNTGKVAAVGIPRDVWSSSLKEKINAAYAYGEASQKGGGLKLARAEVASVIGQPVQYGVVVDFSHFVELIDMVGGVDITVERSFTDHEYPIAGREDDLCGGDPNFGCRYETISYKAGPTHLDGTSALKFVRSRHAEGEEGSDFARNRRQQIVLAALSARMIKTAKSGNIDEITKLYQEVDRIIERDLTNQQAATVAKAIVTGAGLKNMKTVAIPREYFIVPDVNEYEGKYVLIPTSGSFDSIHSYVQDEFNKTSLSKSSE